MRCHECEMGEYRETVQDRDEAMDDGEVERITVTVLDCPTCHAQALSYPANLLKRHAAALCFRPQRLSAASVAWLRKIWGGPSSIGASVWGARLSTPSTGGRRA